MKKKDRIFIAGHNGLVGSSILQILKEKGYKNLITIDRKKLDLRNFNDVIKYFKSKKIDYMVMAAAKAGGIIANSSNQKEFFLDNIEIQNTLLKLAQEKKIKRTIFLGTSCIYPKFSKTPIKEESLLTGTLEKTNQCYAIAKIAGIKLCESLRIQYDFDAISLMPTNLYGKGDNYHPTNSHVMASLLRKFYEAKTKNNDIVSCWGTGAPMREFMHVDDLGEACLFVLEKWDPNSNKAPRTKDNKTLSYINVGTGKDISIKNLANKVAKIYSYEGKIEWDHSKPDGTPKKQLDISRLSDLGWKAKIELDEGIKTTLKTINHDLNNFKK